MPRVDSAGVLIIVVSIALGLTTGVAEEVLWRGVYLSLFPNSTWCAIASGYAACRE
jgi:membrane protease YdiL (CAAX protease family)